MEKISNKQLGLYEKSYKILKLIMETTFDEITITDEHGVFLDVSNSCEKIFGRTIGEFIGKTCYELEKEGVFSKSVTRMVLETKKKTTLVQNTGGGKKLIVTGTPLFNDDGKLIRVINISRDITDTEKLNKKIKEAKNLLNWYSEELKKRKHIEKSDFVTKSPSMKKIVDTITQIANLETTILLTGDTGVGKGYISKAIHNISARHSNPFIQINCGAIPDHLLESELFGYEKGAFTGAGKNGKKGLFEIAGAGTIFLDEIGEMPGQLQVKLLTVLEEKKVFRVGGVTSFKVNARIIAATNQNIHQLLKERRFRSDLYYRLNVMPIFIPPLKERPEDILVFAHKFIDEFNEKYHRRKKLSQQAYDAFLHYDWPGNVRELENVVERLVISCQDELINEMQVHGALPINNGMRVEVNEVVPLNRALDDLERKLILRAYQNYGTTRKAAEALEINQSTVVRKLKKIRESKR